ncbi:MAG: hypothetical protein MRJ66_14755 [Nitrospira sp.]|nr:hypothetical protein [Nitrospira sp.]
MKLISACLFGLCGAVVISVAVPVAAERLSIGMGASARHAAHQDWLERNPFLYKVIENSAPERYGMPPAQLGQDQSSRNSMGNDDINLPDSGANRSMTPSADVPNSVHGGGPNPLPTYPDARPGPERDPAVRDLGGSGMSAPSAPPGSLGR